jgi:hypothetical protein
VWGLLTEARVPVVVHAGHAPVGTEYTGPGPGLGLGQEWLRKVCWDNPVALFSAGTAGVPPGSGEPAGGG